jgi:hypothetical protein
MILKFFVNLMIFFLPKKWSNIPLFIFIFHICVNFWNKKKTSHDMCIGMFLITLSHFERITWIFLHMMGAITIFEKKNWIFEYCGLWIGDKVTWGSIVHIWEGWQRKQIVKRWMWIFLQLWTLDTYDTTISIKINK